MNFVDMTNEDWDEVRRQHDAMVQMGQLEMQTEEIRESRPAGAPPRAPRPVERDLRELDDLVASISH